MLVTSLKTDEELSGTSWLPDLPTFHANSPYQRPPGADDPLARFEVRGLQLEGRAVVLPEQERPQAIALYLKKFPDVARLFESPRNEHEQVIAERLRKTAFWRLTPRWIRVLDSRRGFGWKQELEL